MNNKNFKLAGWITLFFLPAYLLSPYIGMLIVAFAFYNFKKFINERFAYTMANRDLSFIYYSYVMFVVLALSVMVTKNYTISTLGSLGVSLFIGVNLIMLVRKIREMENAFFGMKKILVGSVFAVGLCYVLNGVGMLAKSSMGEAMNLQVMRGIGIGLLILHVLLCAVVGLIFIKSAEENK